jgi:chromosome segregation ATPase
MNTLHLRKLYWVFLFCLIGSPSIASAQAQQPSQNETNQILKELVGEFRLLRHTLQKINISLHRSQVLVERIRAQNDQVSRTSRELDEARKQAANMQMNSNTFTERLKSLEAQILQESDEKRRAPLEAELKDFKYVLQHHKQQEQQVQEQETRLSNQLQKEQAKLDELEARLDLLDRELTNEVEKQESEDKNRDKKRPQ